MFGRPPTCTATLPRSGYRCRFAARRETGLCINHDPAYRVQQVANRTKGLALAAEARARRAQSPLYTFNMDLSDRTAVQALLDTIIRLELSGRIPLARSRNLIRAIAIATRNFDPPARTRDGNRRSAHNYTDYVLRQRAIQRRVEAVLARAEQHEESGPRS